MTILSTPAPVQSNKQLPLYVFLAIVIWLIAYNLIQPLANWISYHPKALVALSEIGIKHNGRSKRADEFRDVDFDLVVTVCDSAAEECPVWLGKGKRTHHSFPDPALTDNINDFRTVHDDIEKEMVKLMKEYS